MIGWITHIYRYVIQRKHWVHALDPEDNVHRFPNRDLIRHEATDCPCGPTVRVHQDEDGADCWHYDHHSLDAREGRR